MKRLILFIFFLLFLLACGNVQSNLVRYASPTYPISFLLPEGWAITDNEDSITIASEETLLLAASVSGGARVNIIVTPSQFTGTANATEVLDTAVRGFRNQATTTVIQDIETVVINSQSAVQTILRGQDAQGNETILRYMVIENLTVNQTAIVAAVHDAAQNDLYGPILTDVINSIQLGEPSPAP